MSLGTITVLPDCDLLQGVRACHYTESACDRVRGMCHDTLNAVCPSVLGNPLLKQLQW